MSDTPKHTPGPWHWERHPDRSGYVALATNEVDVILPTSDFEGRVVAEVSPADAALIAAAPDLLAACVGMAERLDEYAAELRQDDMPGEAANVERIANTLRAAAAKGGAG